MKATKEHGLLYAPELVKADLAGRKTMTRRPVTFENSTGMIDDKSINKKTWPDLTLASNIRWKESSALPFPTIVHIKINNSEYKIVSRVQPGHNLWFRETFWLPHSYPSDNGGGITEDDYQDYPPSACKGRPVHYNADGPPPNIPNKHYPKGLRNGSYSAADPYSTWHKHPSIHMPRWASRIVHPVARVRLEPIHNISDADALAEGIEYETADPPFYYVPGIWPHSKTAVDTDKGAKGSFQKLWDLKYGEGTYAWKYNPLVWVYDYELGTKKKNQKEV